MVDDAATEVAQPDRTRGATRLRHVVPQDRNTWHHNISTPGAT